MRKLTSAVCSLAISWSLVASPAWAAKTRRLNDRESMKCIESDKKTQSVFQDLQAAYEMRLISARDFFNIMDRPKNCEQLRTDLKKLQASAVAQFPAPKPGGVARQRTGQAGDSSVSSGPAMPLPPDMSGFGAPPPPEIPDSEFYDDEFEIE